MLLCHTVNSIQCGTKASAWYCTVCLWYFAEVVLVAALQPGSVLSTLLWFAIDVLYCSPQIERRMELVRAVSHNTHKRLVTCLQGQVGKHIEKRHERVLYTLNSLAPLCVVTTLLDLHELCFCVLQKKLPLTALSQAMQDGGSQLGEESLIG